MSVENFLFYINLVVQFLKSMKLYNLETSEFDEIIKNLKMKITFSNFIQITLIKLISII